MFRRFSIRLPAFALAGLAILSLCHPARADLQASLVGDGINSIAGNNQLTVNLTSGTTNVAGTLFGTDHGGFAPGTSGLDASTFTVTASAPGTVTVVFSENNNTLGAGLSGDLVAHLTGSFVTGAGTITYQSFALNGGVLPTGVPPVPPWTATGVVGPNGTSTATFTAGSTYSLAGVLTITFTSAGVASVSSDGTTTFFGVPELDPGSMASALALVSGGLLVLTGRLRRVIG